MRDDLGKLFLRINIGGLMLFHGVAKLGHGIPGIVANVERHGLPKLFAYGVYLGEVVAPILLLIGLFTRPSAMVVTINMVVAIWLSHAADVFTLGKAGQWGIELQMLYLLGAVAIMFLGAGRLSASRGKGRWD